VDSDIENEKKANNKIIFRGIIDKEYKY